MGIRHGVDHRLDVICELSVPAILVPPLGALRSDLRQDRCRLAFPESPEDSRHLLVLFLRRSCFDAELLGLGLLTHLLRLCRLRCHRLLLFHVRVLRRGLPALDHIERHDQLITALKRRQVVVGSRLVPGHPGTADSSLKDGCTFLKGALELLCEVEFDISQIRIRADHRQEKSIDPLLQHLQDRTKALSIERSRVVLRARICLRVSVPNERRIDPVGSRAGLSR